MYLLLLLQIWYYMELRDIFTVHFTAIGMICVTVLITLWRKMETNIPTTIIIAVTAISSSTMTMYLYQLFRKVTLLECLAGFLCSFHLQIQYEYTPVRSLLVIFGGTFLIIEYSVYIVYLNISFRCADARKVWYEWCLVSPVRTAIQNSGGKAYSVGL